MSALYKSPFMKFVKKHSRGLQLTIQDAAQTIVDNPGIGEAKKGDLSGFRVYKFRFQGQEYLVAYKTEGKAIVFYMIGTHENFYRDLKKYLRGGQ